VYVDRLSVVSEEVAVLASRSRILAFGLCAALALSFAAVAGAKQTRVTVVTPSTAPRASVPWPLTVRVALGGKPYAKAGYRPALYLVDTSGRPVATFHGTPAAPGRFIVRVLFPHAGTWRYVVADPLNGEWSFRGLKVAR
jgi:hypothetical protein